MQPVSHIPHFLYLVSGSNAPSNTRSTEEKETLNLGRQVRYEINYKFMMATKIL
jgi:hypothetical protein